MPCVFRGLQAGVTIFVGSSAPTQVAEKKEASTLAFHNEMLL